MRDTRRAGGDTLDWQALIDAHVEGTARRHAPERNRHVPDVDLPLSDVTTYRTVSITDVGPGRGEVADLDAPVDLLALGRELAAPTGPDNPDPYGAGVAVGVILDFEQAWRMKGLSAGRLLHSLCLAPGEVTQIAMVDWRRDTKGSSSSTVAERERASRDVERDRVTRRVTDAVSSELSRGGSSASSISHHADGGASFLGIGGGGSANHSVATSVNWNTGSRSASASSIEQVRQRTSQQVSNVRARQATLVQEVSESETEQFTTRVVANYNHMHSLNMQYYEVLQNYELQARAVRAERCLFLPMAVLTFDADNILTFANELVGAARAMGRAALATAVADLAADASGARRDLARAQLRLPDARARFADAERALAIAQGRLSKEALEEEARRTRALDEQPALESELRFRTARIRELEARINPLGAGGVLAGIASGLSPELARELEQHRSREKALFAELSELRLVIPRDARLPLAVEAAKVQLNAARQVLEALQREIAVAEGVDRTEKAKIVGELNEDRLAFNQAIWLNMTPATVGALLEGREHLGTSLLETVDPAPVAVVGTWVGFRWSFPDTPDGEREAEAFRARHLDAHDEAVLDSRVLPTGGVFAEAVRGRANAAEKLDLSRFWHWDEDTIPILPTAIDKLRSARRVRRSEAAPGTLGAPGVAAAPLPDLPDGPSHAIADTLGASLFRDLSGAAAIASLLEEGQKQAAAGASHAMDVTHENIKAYLDHLEVVLPELAKVAGPGKLNPSKLGALGNALGGAGGTGAAGGAGGGKGLPLKPDALLKLAGKAGLLG